MIDIRQQEEMFIAIGNMLDKKISVYAIGGTSMMLRGIKAATLDIDIVFDKKNDKDEFVTALKKLGARDFDVTLVYGFRRDSPIMLELQNARFDLFMDKVVNCVFSEKMKQRAKQVHEYGENLIVKAADVQDLIIMKSATSRIKDLDDITSIIKKNVIDWNSLIDEAKEQVRLGNETAILSLGEKLERLYSQKVIEIPKYVLDDLFKLLKKQVGVKGKKKRLVK